MEELKMLDDLVSQAKSLCATLTNAINYAHNVEKEAQAKLKSANDKEASNTLESANLVSREAKVKGIEDIIKIAVDSKERLKEINTLTDKLEEERAAFRKEATAKLREIAAKEHKVAEDNISLEKGWVSLHEKEKSYRAEIETDIMKRFKK